MIILMLIIAVFLIGADQLIKQWAVGELMNAVASREFIKIGSRKIIDLTYTENTGAAFSIMSGKKWFTIGFTLVALIIFLVYMLKTYKNSKYIMILTAVIVGGGVGNLIDRIRLGYVIDYIEVKLFHFAVFNFADICVTVGMALLLIYIIFFENSREKAKKKEDVSDE